MHASPPAHVHPHTVDQPASLRQRDFLSYALIGLPLAMSALPVYVQIPAYYAGHFHLDLALLGLLLFAARMIDALQDPLLGYVVSHRQSAMTRLLQWAAGLFLIGFTGIWLPPVSGQWLYPWLALSLIITYGTHSLLTICGLTIGAQLVRPDSPQHATVVLRASAWREGCGLLGVVIASIMTPLILQEHGTHIAVLGFCTILAVVLLAAIKGLARHATLTRRVVTDGATSITALRNQLRAIWRYWPLRSFMLIYLINGIAMAIPATLIVFFAQDWLQAQRNVSEFLSVYFVGAALGLPAWTALSRFIGPITAWKISMVLAIVAFACVLSIQPGATHIFNLVCLLSGLTLGADLAVPSTMVARLVHDGQPVAASYGVMTLLGKCALAFAALALPALHWLGYTPGQPAGLMLPMFYALLPCALKALALLALSTMQPVLEQAIGAS